MTRNFATHAPTATTDAGRSNAAKVPAAGQAEGGHPHVMQPNHMGKRIFSLTKRPAFTPLKIIMAGVLVAGAYKLFVVEPSKQEYQFDPERREAEITETASPQTATLARKNTWSFGPFTFKDKGILGIKPSDKKLEEQPTTYSAAGTVASVQAHKGEKVDAV